MLRLESVRRIYKISSGEICALNDANFTVNSGEFTAIMGPSGSGKSTLMHIIGCLDRPTSGLYLMDNMDVNHLSDNDLAKIRNQKIGFIFQTFNLLPRMSVLKNVELPLMYAGYPRGKKRLSMAWEALESVELSDRAHHKPNELSGGQQQRVAIARALVRRPALLLADEPTGSLDSATGEEVMRIFLHLNQEGMTIILVTHEEPMANYARRVVRLKDGRIVKNG